MSSTPAFNQSTSARARGRGHSRGGLGKYLRARGRRGQGRPAVFRERLQLEGEAEDEIDEEEAAKQAAKYSRRQLGSNADRYVEPEPELGSDGEPIVEPEVDISNFLQRQRLSDDRNSHQLEQSAEDEDEVDHTLIHLNSGSMRRAQVAPQKGKVEVIEWDAELESMAREKAAAEATWELKDRFRAKAEKLKSKPIPRGPPNRRGDPQVSEAPALPTDDPPKDTKAEMQDFLDDLLG